MKTMNEPIIFDVPFYTRTKTELIHNILTNFDALSNYQIVTANPEMLMQGKHIKKFHSIIQSADMVVPDGIGVLIAAKILNKNIKERITGFDLLIELLKMANDKALRVAFVGAEEKRLMKMKEKIENDFPQIQSFYQHGYFTENEKPQIYNKIKSFSPDFIFVALGAPKQEFFIEELKQTASFKMAMGVGGCFDILSGELKRAPLIWQKFGLEWFYRIIQDPKRIKRSLVLPVFLIHIFKDKFQKK